MLARAISGVAEPSRVMSAKNLASVGAQNYCDCEMRNTGAALTTTCQSGECRNAERAECRTPAGRMPKRNEYRQTNCATI